MHIEINGTQYPCQCRPGSDMVYRGLPEDFPAPVVSIVTLCRDDGLVLRGDDPADYLRQTFSGGVLVLTNAPEPAPSPEPEPQTELTAEDLAEAILNIQTDLILIKEGITQ